VIAQKEADTLLPQAKTASIEQLANQIWYQP
jgi:hypothetical protein